MKVDTEEDWDVIVPSRKRSQLMGRILSMFPHAKIYVDERERADYAAVVPPEQLFLHPCLPGQQYILDYALKRETTPAVLMLDDDFEGVYSLVDMEPRPRLYTHPDDLCRIVENMLNMMIDLDLHWGGWNTSPHPGTFMPYMPFAMTGTIRGAMLLRGRDVVKIDPAIDSFDLDMTLQALLKDRYLLKDMRLFFSFGDTHKNSGGYRGVETDGSWEKDRQLLTKKWGPYLLVGGLPVSSRMHGGDHQAVGSFGHKVQRKSPTVTHAG